MPFKRSFKKLIIQKQFTIFPIQAGLWIFLANRYITVSYLLGDSEGGELELEITDVRVRKVGGDGKMKAVASVTFDNDFVVHDIKIIEGQSGMFIAMPSRKTPDGEYRDIAHPINSDMRARLQGMILQQYDQIDEE